MALVLFLEKCLLVYLKLTDEWKIRRKGIPMNEFCLQFTPSPSNVSNDKQTHRHEYTNMNYSLSK